MRGRYPSALSGAPFAEWDQWRDVVRNLKAKFSVEELSRHTGIPVTIIKNWYFNCTAPGKTYQPKLRRFLASMEVQPPPRPVREAPLLAN